MKNKILFVFLLLCPLIFFGQEKEFTPHGNPFVTIYANFHQGIYGEATDKAAFELVRGYIGYEYYFNNQFYAKINVDVGSPDDFAPASKIKRYAYFKNAFLRYSWKKIKVDFGLISLRQFKLQESIWERRYLRKTVIDEHRLGASADLGVNFNYKFSEKIDADFTIVNGEGYTSLQNDNIFKYSLGSTVKIPENFTSRVVYDFIHKGVSETTFLFFTSYNYKSVWNIAGEFIFKRNFSWVENQNITAWSFFGKYNINMMYQLFARVDLVKSNILKDDLLPWRSAKDGSALIAGIQLKPINNITMALSYQDWFPKIENEGNKGFVYFNIEVKI